MEIVLIPEVVILLFIETLLLFFYLVVLKHAIAILRFFDINSNQPQQYELEKKSYFAATAIKVGLIIGFLQLPYLIFILDKLSYYLPGAMCAAGVVGANPFGTPLIMSHIIFLLVSAFWLAVHQLDLKSETLQYTRIKFGIYISLFVLFMLKYALLLIYLNNLDPQQAVACCSLLYGSGQFGDTSIQKVQPWMLSTAFVTLFLLTLFVTFKRWSFAAIVANIIMLMFSIYAVTHLFSPYVYELPTHHCPYCLFQPEYLYVGYLLFALLLTAAFTGIVSAQIKLMLERDLAYLFRISMLAWVLFAMLCGLYPIRYYLVNGVWL